MLTVERLRVDGLGRRGVWAENRRDRWPLGEAPSPLQNDVSGQTLLSPFTDGWFSSCPLAGAGENGRGRAGELKQTPARVV
ncbi:hypothetical protein DPEC_G00248710 [Dallia pectoralis]|uniref:Uncharacterized protein n=1 Tax=Dallia pectoralis TaxID=75939 RepID=A0ACC2FX26_DALPE|nr:hypothetical protein DPEC_G00248710 [Dallia pectoralis]